ncbi:hypothetical protein HanRHA438_Chr10g0433031 [Helianthus annuus]|nr:hypothetical protein HanRHA438_Chr10g0433031 [Helianthus annuus]
MRRKKIVVDSRDRVVAIVAREWQWWWGGWRRGGGGGGVGGGGLTKVPFSLTVKLTLTRQKGYVDVNWKGEGLRLTDFRNKDLICQCPSYNLSTFKFFLTVSITKFFK